VLRASSDQEAGGKTGGISHQFRAEIPVHPNNWEWVRSQTGNVEAGKKNRSKEKEHGKENHADQTEIVFLEK